MGGSRGMTLDRIPRSLDEARALVAYNQRILQTSQSPQRRHRASRMLENLEPVMAQLEADAQARAVASAAATREHGDFEVVFSGRESLDKFRWDR